MINITSHYYAALRDEAGCAQETIETTAESAQQLYEELRQRHDFSYAPDDMKVAINDAFSNMSSALSEGDAVVFIPPVAGG